MSARPRQPSEYAVRFRAAAPRVAAQRLRTLSLAAWTGSGSGRGIGTERGTRGRSARSRFPYCCRSTSSCRFVVVAFEESDHYVEAAAVTVVAVPVLIVRDGSSRPGPDPPCGAVGSRPRGRSGEGTGGHLHLGSAEWLPERWWATLCGPPCYWSLSVRSPGRRGSRLVQYGILGAVSRNCRRS